MEIEAPQAVELVQRGMKGLLDNAPRTPSRRQPMSGE